MSGQLPKVGISWCPLVTGANNMRDLQANLTIPSLTSNPKTNPLQVLNMNQKEIGHGYTLANASKRSRTTFCPLTASNSIAKSQSKRFKTINTPTISNLRGLWRKSMSNRGRSNYQTA